MRISSKLLHDHWPEYLMEGFGIAVIMLVSASITAAVETNLGHGWPGWARRSIEAAVIAGTVVGLIYSPWGRRSGAHYNPAVTLTFYALGRVTLWNAIFYVVCQLAGALLGIFAAGAMLGRLLREPPAMWIVTRPGAYGQIAAFAAEVAIAFVLMSVVLAVGGRPSLARYTGLFAGALVFLYIVFEAPVSGFSMNPARSLASAVAAEKWEAFWIYVVAPPTGMFIAVAINRLLALPLAPCAKLMHDSPHRCIHCGYKPAGA